MVMAMPSIDSPKLYERIEKSLQDQKFDPIYCFHGDEPYLILQAMNYVKACALHGIVADFNLSAYYAGDIDPNVIRDEIETLPMMAPRRVLILREIQNLSESDWECLQPIFLKPVESTVLILSGQKLDKRKKSFRWLSEASVMTEFKRPYENQIPGWIRHIAKGLQLQLSDEVVSLLHRLVGSHLAEIEVELKKLKDYMGDRQQVEIEDVGKAVTRRREDNVFELVETLAKGDKSQSLVQLAGLLSHGQNEVGIVSLVARHIRILMCVKQGMEMGLQGVRLAQHAQVPQYFLNEYVSQAKKWSARKLEQVLLVLGETDRALKSSPLSSHIWLENMILRTCALYQSQTLQA